MTMAEDLEQQEAARDDRAFPDEVCVRVHFLLF